MKPPQELIEKAAAALQEHIREKVDEYGDGEPDWDNAEDWIREHRRGEATAVLEAIAADIWEEGAEAAWRSSGEGWNGEYPEPERTFRAMHDDTVPNPYAKENR